MAQGEKSCPFYVFTGRMFMPTGNAVDSMRRFTSRLSCALLLTTYLTPAPMLLSSAAHADELHAVCRVPGSNDPAFSYDNLVNLADGSTASLLSNSNGGFKKVSNPDGPPTFQLSGVYHITKVGDQVVDSRTARIDDFLQDDVRNLTTVAPSPPPPSGYPDGFNSTDFGNSNGANIAGAFSGLPVLNTVEATNTEVQDLIRQRRQLAQNSQTPSTLASTASSSSANSPNMPVSASSPAPTSNKSSVSNGYASSQNYPVAQGINLDFDDGPNWSSWAQAFADYERHSDLAPGSGENLVRKQTTVGGISGTDATYFRLSEYGHETLQMGLLGGGMHITNNFSDFGDTSDARQTLDGGFVGAYGSYHLNQFAVDGFFKTDMLQLRQRATAKGPATCPTGQVLIIDETPDATEVTKTQSGSVNQYTYTVGANAYYRFDLANGGYFEPVAGFLFSATTYGDGAVANGLGLDNGQFVRLQWGARVGRSWTDDQNRSWSLAFLGLMYDDVYVNGYTVDGSGFPTGASEVDEGKLRVLGQLEGNVDIGNGVSLVGAVNVRGGENLFGVGGRLGARMDW